MLALTYEQRVLTTRHPPETRNDLALLDTKEASDSGAPILLVLTRHTHTRFPCCLLCHMEEGLWRWCRIFSQYPGPVSGGAPVPNNLDEIRRKLRKRRPSRIAEILVIDMCLFGCTQPGLGPHTNKSPTTTSAMPLPNNSAGKLNVAADAVFCLPSYSSDFERL